MFHVSQLQSYRTSTQYRHQQKPPKDGPPALRQALSGDTVRAVIGRKYFGYTSDDGHQYKYFIKWRDQPDSSNQWVLPDDIKKHGRRHPLLNKFDTQVPFTPDEPEPGSHTQIPAPKKELYHRGNISTGLQRSQTNSRVNVKQHVAFQRNVDTGVSTTQAGVIVTMPLH